MVHARLVAIALILVGVVACRTAQPVSAKVKEEPVGGPVAPPAEEPVNSAIANPNMDLDVKDFDASAFPETPERPKTPKEVTQFGLDTYIGGYEVWPGYKIMDLSVWKAQDAAQGPFDISLAECFRKSYWRLYKILQNPPPEYIKMVKEHSGPSSFYVFINDVRNGNPNASWHDKLVNYQNSIVKWLGHWDGKRCTQRTRKDLVDFSVRFNATHPPGWRNNQ